MINIRREISRIKRRLVFTKFLDCSLNSVLIGLCIAGFLLVCGLGVGYSAVVGGLYLTFGFVRAAKKASLKEIEKKIPDLEWQLRTAADNVGKKNEIVEKLNLEVAEKIGFVNFYDLLSGKKTLARMFGIVFLGVLIIYVQNTEFNIVEAVNPEGGEGFFGGITGLFFDEDLEGSGEGDEEYFYGEESDLEKGRRELELELKSEENEVDLEKKGDLEYGKKSGRRFSGQVSGEQDSSYSEEIGIDEEELVKKYMDEIY